MNEYACENKAFTYRTDRTDLAHTRESGCLRELHSFFSGRYGRYRRYSTLEEIDIIQEIRVPTSFKRGLRSLRSVHDWHYRPGAAASARMGAASILRSLFRSRKCETAGGWNWPRRWRCAYEWHA